MIFNLNYNYFSIFDKFPSDRSLLKKKNGNILNEHF